MDTDAERSYERIRSGGAGFYEQSRGLFSIWGKESVPFLDGMITNDMKTLEDGQQMLAAFPNAQGRLVAVVRVRRDGDRFLLEAEEATREKLFQNLFRFTFAGDFFIEDLSDGYQWFEILGDRQAIEHHSTSDKWPQAILFGLPYGTGCFIPADAADGLRQFLAENEFEAIPTDLYEVLRIEAGVPLFGKDMDENTIVPELGLDGLISYNKGCYIGQEIIARIHFRGHVAKQLAGLTLAEMSSVESQELQSQDGRNAGRITSAVFSPQLDATIALGFIRYEHLASGTELQLNGMPAVVTDLPFVV
jgi:folate-binding protein YgfZ